MIQRKCSRNSTRGYHMFLLLLAAWIIFNGAITWEIVLFGIGISAVVYFFACRFLDFSVEKDIKCIKKTGIFCWFTLCLFVEIVKANLITAKWIYSTRYEVEPVLVTFRMHFKTKVARVLYANSITLTPGTITVKQEGNTFTVHALERSYAEDINGGRLADILYRMEEHL